MVSIRLIISFLLVFILLHLSECCISRAHHDMKKTVAEDHGEIATDAVSSSSHNVEQVFEDGVPTATEVEKTMLRGRKMMSEKSLGKEITEEDISIISGAVHSVGHCNRRRKGILSIGCKPRKRKLLTDRKVKMAAFTAFSADYHVPKSHPPKNN